MSNPALQSKEFEGSFSALRKAIEDQTGLLISSKKDKEIWVKLGNEIEQLGGLENFLKKLNSSKRFRQQIVNRLTIGESYFFRNHPHFNALKEKVIPDLINKNKKTKKLKIWSAGCSSGEEPYSIAILLEMNFPELADWEVEIIATDINTDYIKKAKSGRYTAWSFRGVDKKVFETYFKKLSHNSFELLPRIRRRVIFNKLNLSTMAGTVPPEYLKADLILCRNVLIYFSGKLAIQICQSFASALSKHGYLVLGHSESFPRLKNMETIYSHATYYYHRSTNSTTMGVPRTSMSMVPGIAAYDLQKMISPAPHKKAPPAKKQSAAQKKIPSRPALQPTTAPSVGIDEDLKLVRDFSINGELDKADKVLADLKGDKGRLDYRVFFLKAMIEDQRNEIEETLKNLKQAIFINKNFVIGHYYQAIVCERTGDLLTAKRSFKNACELASSISKHIELPEGGGITAGRLLEIASERLKELEL